MGGATGGADPTAAAASNEEYELLEPAPQNQDDGEPHMMYRKYALPNLNTSI